jgi:signal transduction histidine kinase
MFQRLHAKHEYSGTGIGLAICKRIVENHRGIIQASGELGKGATFIIYFPVENTQIPTAEIGNVNGL